MDSTQETEISGPRVINLYQCLNTSEKISLKASRSDAISSPARLSSHKLTTPNSCSHLENGSFHPPAGANCTHGWIEEVSLGEGSVIFDCLRPHGLQLARLLCPWDSPGKSTGGGCHFLLQGIFLTQGSNPHLPHLLHWQMNSLPLWHLGSPY